MTTIIAQPDVSAFLFNYLRIARCDIDNLTVEAVERHALAAGLFLRDDFACSDDEVRRSRYAQSVIKGCATWSGADRADVGYRKYRDRARRAVCRAGLAVIPIAPSGMLITVFEYLPGRYVRLDHIGKGRVYEAAAGKRRYYHTRTLPD